jgi:hypothetical protein
MKRLPTPSFAQVFGEAVRLVAADYAQFVRSLGRLQPEDDPKIFAGRHAAARACLSHLAQLLDLVGEDGGIDHVRDGFALLHEARQALGLPVPEEDAPDDRSGDA